MADEPVAADKLAVSDESAVANPAEELVEVVTAEPGPVVITDSLEKLEAALAAEAAEVALAAEAALAAGAAEAAETALAAEAVGAVELAAQESEEPQPQLGAESSADERAEGSVELYSCAQCGTMLEAGDIFCGECGFVRQQPATARPQDTVALDPFPWGVPTGFEEVSLREEPVPTFGDDIEATRIVDRSPRGDRFVLQFSTGESVSVTGSGILGRNPIAEPGEYFDSLVAISDPGKSVSKTHLEFGQDDGTFWISDRYSGNGTVLRQPEAQPRRCEAGKRYRIARGTRVDIGEQFFIVS